MRKHGGSIGSDCTGTSVPQLEYPRAPTTRRACDEKLCTSYTRPTGSLCNDEMDRCYNHKPGGPVTIGVSFLRLREDSGARSNTTGCSILIRNRSRNCISM